MPRICWARTSRAPVRGTGVSLGAGRGCRNGGTAFEDLEAVGRDEKWHVRPRRGDGWREPIRWIRRLAPFGAPDIDHEVDVAPIDAEVERRGRHHGFPNGPSAMAGLDPCGVCPHIEATRGAGRSAGLSALMRHRSQKSCSAWKTRIDEDQCQLHVPEQVVDFGQSVAGAMSGPGQTLARVEHGDVGGGPFRRHDERGRRVGPTVQIGHEFCRLAHGCGEPNGLNAGAPGVGGERDQAPGGSPSASTPRARATRRERCASGRRRGSWHRDWRAAARSARGSSEEYREGLVAGAGASWPMYRPCGSRYGCRVPSRSRVVSRLRATSTDNAFRGGDVERVKAAASLGSAGRVRRGSAGSRPESCRRRSVRSAEPSVQPPHAPGGRADAVEAPSHGCRTRRETARAVDSAIGVRALQCRAPLEPKASKLRRRVPRRVQISPDGTRLAPAA